MGSRGKYFALALVALMSSVAIAEIDDPPPLEAVIPVEEETRPEPPGATQPGRTAPRPAAKPTTGTTPQDPSLRLLTFDRAVDIAVSNSPELEQIRSRARGEGHRRTRAVLRLLPEIDFRADYLLVKASTSDEANPRSRAPDLAPFAGVTAFQRVFDGGRSIYQVELTNAVEEGLKYQERAVRLRTRLDLIPVYYRALMWRAKREVYDTRLRMLATLSGRAQGHFRSAAIPKSDLNRVILEKHRCLFLQEDASMRYDAALNQLRQMLRLGPNEPVGVKDSFLPLDIKEPPFDSRKLPPNYFVLVSRDRQIRARRQIDMAQGLPDLNLTATYGWRSNGNGELFTGDRPRFGAGFVVRIPFTEAIASLATHAEYGEELKRNALDRNQLLADLRLEMDHLAESVERLKRTVRQAQSDMKPAASILREVVAAYQAGELSTGAMLDTYINTQNFQIIEAELMYEYSTSMARLIALRDPR